MDFNTEYKRNLFLQSKKRNLKIFFIIIAFFIFLIFLFFWKIQIIDYEKYEKAAEKNILRKERIPPLRGLIKDEKGNIIADNRLSFDLVIPKENYLPSKKKKTEEEIKKIFSLLKGNTNFSLKNMGTYYLIKEDIPIKVVNYVFSNRREFRYISIRVSPRRLYPLKKSCSSFLGYIGEANAKEIKKFKLKIGDFVGKYGLERFYENKLKGRDGYKLKIVNNLNILQNVIKEIPPQKGDTLYLSINLKLQKKIEEMMERKKLIGSTIVLNPKNGEILSLVTTPLFDPNLFTSYFSKKKWDELINTEGKPLINKSISGLYSPGSIFKLIVGLAGLEEGIINENKIINCYGYKEIYNKIFHCWKSTGHGPVNLTKAIEQSCDVYFYLLGKNLKIDLIEKYAKMMGLGKKTGIDLVGEKSGLVPSREWKFKRFKVIWFPGETISVSIGQGPLLVTPIQIAQLFSIIANRGFYYPPHLLKTYHPKKQYVKIKRDNFEKIIKGMWLVVNGEKGTGKLAKLANIDVCGKTSTVQVVSKETLKTKVKNKEDRRWLHHSWFGAFAPCNNPEIVVVIMLEHAGSGGESAAPLSKEIMKIYFNEVKNKK